MISVHIAKPQFTLDGGCSVLTAKITVGADRHSVWYRSRASVAHGVEPFLVASLFAAMRTGLPLRTDEPVSSLLLSNLQQVQEIFHSWDRTLSIVPVEAPAKRDHDQPASEVACFFSGGVDSFYSALKHLREITALIFVHGFDLPLKGTSLRAQVRESLHAAANHLKLPLLEVETNLRSLSDRYLNWNYSHGAALTSVALLFSGQLRQVYVPSSYAYAELFPWGSHPLVDRLWGTERLALIHDGCEALRMEKVVSIARHDVVLRHLRVCYENTDGMYNCGRCAKCLRAMVSLRLAGALDRCTTFERPLDPHTVARIRVKTPNTLKFLEDAVHALETSGRDPDLVQSLRSCLDNQANLQAAEDEKWEQDTILARSELAQLISEGECLILIDENYLGDELVGNRHTLPFTERDGQYWGPPADDASAIAEFERLRRVGANYVVIAWPAFWWLEHYAG